MDRIYKDFSESVGVRNIREYEENQLKGAQQMAEQRIGLSNQMSKLKSQYVIYISILSGSYFLLFYTLRKDLEEFCLIWTYARNIYNRTIYNYDV